MRRFSAGHAGAALPWSRSPLVAEPVAPQFDVMFRRVRHLHLVRFSPVTGETSPRQQIPGFFKPLKELQILDTDEHGGQFSVARDTKALVVAGNAIQYAGQIDPHILRTNAAADRLHDAHDTPGP